MTKLTTQTLDILKNFASINSNLLVKANEPIATISEAKNIMAVAAVDTFDSTFGIYDLNEFISMFGLMEDPELHFSDNSVRFQSGRTTASYRFADPSILTTPGSKIKMPEADLVVTVEEEILGQIRKAAGALGHTIASITGADGVVTLSVGDPKNSAANTFSIIIDESNDQKANFDLHFLIGNLKVIPGDYTVQISSKLISHWQNTSQPVQYFIALEKTSNFNL
jgi:hypothetical protein